MRIIKPSIEFFGAVPTDYDSALKFIEICGRVCYKSEDKITPESAEPFVKRLINAGHLAMVEHSNFVVRHKGEIDHDLIVGKYLNVIERVNGYTYIGGNMTAWFQAAAQRAYFKPFYDVYGELFGLPEIKQSYCMKWEVCPHDEIPKELHRYSAKFICNRAVTHELVRHRQASYGQESQRFCNYGSKEIEFIEPVDFDKWNFMAGRQFMLGCKSAEDKYNSMLSNGLKPQQARLILPNACKTEIVVTCDAQEWSHIRKLRTAKDADPEMQRVMAMVPWDEFL